MLSVNSNVVKSPAISQPEFKGKPSTKMKKAYKAMEEIHWRTIMSDPRISNEVKKNLLVNKAVSDLSQMNWFEKLKLFFKKPF